MGTNTDTQLAPSRPGIWAKVTQVTLTSRGSHGLSPRRIRLRPTAIRRPFNRLPCGCFLASSFDAWKKVDRIGLYRRGPSVQRGQTRRIERGVPRVRRLTTSSVTEIHGSFALERAFEVPWLVPSDRRQPAEAACDVRSGRTSAAKFSYSAHFCLRTA